MLGNYYVDIVSTLKTALDNYYKHLSFTGYVNNKLLVCLLLLLFYEEMIAAEDVLEEHEALINKCLLKLLIHSCWI